jgi:hypothetical protein
MLEHTLDSANGILHLRPKGSLRKEDFEQLAQMVDPYLEKKGELAGLIIDAPAFPGWDSLGAMVTHLRFVRDHHKRVRKIAVVTDARFGNIAERLASHFVAATVKHFPAAEMQAAQRWIGERS